MTSVMCAIFFETLSDLTFAEFFACEPRDEHGLKTN